MWEYIFGLGSGVLIMLIGLAFGNAMAERRQDRENPKKEKIIG